MFLSACSIIFLTICPPILPASLADISPLYPSFRLTPTSLGVKKIFTSNRLNVHKLNNKKQEININYFAMLHSCK